MIRPLQIHDLLAIVAIEQQNPFPWTEGVLRDCFNAPNEIYGVELNNKIIAYAVMRLVQDEGEILNIATDQNFRRQGHGELLLRYLLDMAKQKNVKAVYLETRASNMAAIHLYQKLGFKKMGVRENYYPATQGREDAIVWCLSH